IAFTDQVLSERRSVVNSTRALTADGSCDFKRFLNRIRPAISQCSYLNINDTTGRPLVTLHIDHQAVPAHRPDPGCPNACIPRPVEQMLGNVRLDREDYAGLTFSEQERVAPQAIER